MTRPRHARPKSPAALPALLPALLLLCALSGCGTAPQAPGAVRPAAAPAADVAAAPRLAFAQQQREVAAQAQAQGRWADAARAWELLMLLQPQDEQVRAGHAAVQQHIQQQRDRHAAAALAAQQGGQLDAAQKAWLQVLALDPQDAAAATALRHIEIERSSRTHLGRFARASRPRDGAGPASTSARDQRHSDALKPISR